jgi:hypothetical protein
MSLSARLDTVNQTNDATLVATITFFRALRREWASQTGKPAEECPVPNWEDVRPMERQKFLKCMKSALASAKPDNVLKVIENAKAL